MIDDYYDSLGLETIDADWLLQGLEDAGIRGNEDFTFVIPRQLPTDTVEQIGMTVIGDRIGSQLVDNGDIDSYRVTGAPLQDKMYGRNAEKRGYAFPAAVTADSVVGAKAADIRDGYSIGSHEPRIEGAEALEEVGLNPEAETLRGMHEGRTSPVVQSSGEFTELQQNMLSVLLEEDQQPEMIGAEYSDGKMVGLRYDPEHDVYRSLDEDRPMELGPEEAAETGVLLPEDNYEKLIFPLALHDQVGYMLKGLENDKFRTDRTRELEEAVEKRGLDFPFLDASPGGKYHELVPDEAVEGLEDTRYGSSSSLGQDAVVLNAYPSVSLRDNLEPEELHDETFEQMMANVIHEVYGR